MTQISNENKMQPDPLFKQSMDQAAIDPATGLPIDPKTGQPISLDTVESMSDAEVFNFFASMFDLLDFKESALIANNPQIPAPFLTRIGILREAIAKGQIRQGIDADATTKNIKGTEILQTTLSKAETTKNQTVRLAAAADNQLTSASDNAKPNPWLQNTNAIGAMMIVSLAIAKSMAAAKMDESKLKQILNMKIYELGMDAAEDAKKLKDLQARQETMKAINSFVTAGVAVYQMFSIANQRAQDEKEVEKQIDAQKELVKTKQTEHDGLESGATDGDDAAVLAFNKKTEKGKELEIEKTKLTKMQENQEQMMYDISRRNTSFNDAKFKAFNSFIDGSFTLAGTFITGEQGEVEKHMKELEVLQQIWSKQRDSFETHINDANSLMEKALSIAERMSSETKAMLATRG